MCLRKKTRGRAIEIENNVKNTNWDFLKTSTEKIYWTHHHIFFLPLQSFVFFLFFFFDGSIAINLPPSCPDFEEYLPLTSLSILLKGSQKLLQRKLWRLHPSSPHPLGRQCQLIVKAQHVKCCHPSELWVSETKLKGWLNVLMAATYHNNDMARFPCSQLSSSCSFFQIWSPNLHCAFHMSLLCFRVRADLC